MIKRCEIFCKCIVAALITISAVLIMELINLGATVQFSLAPAFVIIVAIAYVGGLRCSFVSSLIVGAYSFYLSGLSPRFFIILVSALSITFMSGYLKRRARMFDTLNGNIRSVEQALAIARFLRSNWHKATVQTVDANLMQIEDLLGNLAARIMGWHQLRKEMGEVKKFYQEGYEKIAPPEKSRPK